MRYQGRVCTNPGSGSHTECFADGFDHTTRDAETHGYDSKGSSTVRAGARVGKKPNGAKPPLTKVGPSREAADQHLVNIMNHW